MGFGHRVYRAEDPRVAPAQAASRRRSTRRTSTSPRSSRGGARALLQERSPDRVLATNVEFYSAVVLDVAAIPPRLAPAMFACSRRAGWSAHILEQKRTGRLFRPPRAMSARQRAGRLRRSDDPGGGRRARRRARAAGDERARDAAAGVGRRARARGPPRRLPRPRAGLPGDRAVPLPPEARARPARAPGREPGGARLGADRARRALPRPPRRRQRDARAAARAGDNDPNVAVRRLAIVCLKNGSPQRETILLLNGLADDDDEEPTSARRREPWRPPCRSARQRSDRRLVGVIMGSRSDWETMRHAGETLGALGGAVRRAGRLGPPDARPALRVRVGGRGTRPPGADRRGRRGGTCPGWTAAKTDLPVLGVPVESKTLKGMDSLLSIVQMPAGVPVGTLAIGRAGAVNAALLAAAIVGASDAGVRERLDRVPGGADRVGARGARPGCVGDGVLVAVIGGGQLGRMLALAGIPLGLSFRFLDPSPDAPAGEVGELLVGAYDDPPLLDRLAGADVVTYEFENVPVEAARRVGAVPAAGALEASQDRLEEKRLFRRLGIPTTRIDDEVEPSRRPPQDTPPRLRRKGPAPCVEDVCAGRSPRTRPGGARRVRPRALAPRRPRPRRRDALLPAGRERARGRDPAHLARPGRRRAAGARRGVRARLLDELGYVGVLALELFEADGGCSPTSSRRASTTRATGRSRAPRRASSRTTSARSSVCRSARPTRAGSLMVNLIGSTPAVSGRPAHPRSAPPPLRQGGRKLGHVTLVEPLSPRPSGRSDLVAQSDRGRRRSGRGRADATDDGGRSRRRGRSAGALRLEPVLASARRRTSVADRHRRAPRANELRVKRHRGPSLSRSSRRA